MKIFVKILIALLALIVVAIAAFFIINSIVIGEAKNYVYGIDDIGCLEKADCVLVPGALVTPGGGLSEVLHDRIDFAIRIYKAGKADKLLFSGDHGQDSYDEVNAMMNYAVSHDVPEKDIFLDHAGFSTYESVYRARDIFLVKRVIIVTQQFHISRAVYVARKLGLDAAGVNSDPREYSNAVPDAIRESFARVKDFFLVNLFLPEPEYLGDTIPIFGDSGVTHDKG